MKSAIFSVLLAVSLLWAAGPDSQAKHAKKYTITDRQMALRQKVSVGLKANELTAKEAKKLNDRLNDLEVAIAKMKTKNGGQLSYKDQGKIEKRLNGISLDTEKYELKKRVTAR